MTNPNYLVKRVETIATGGGMRARLYTLAPGDIIPWHFHNDVTDWYFCLAGALRIDTQSPRMKERVPTGKHYIVPPKAAHRVSNDEENADCRFLLLQGFGIFDFNQIGDRSDPHH